MAEDDLEFLILQLPSLKGMELKAGTWRQELKQKPHRTAAYWLDVRDLCSLLSYATLDHLFKGDTTCSGLGPPTLTINQEDTSQICP